jgi:hypothetical protein
MWAARSCGLTVRLACTDCLHFLHAERPPCRAVSYYTVLWQADFIRPDRRLRALSHYRRLFYFFLDHHTSVPVHLDITFHELAYFGLVGSSPESAALCFRKAAHRFFVAATIRARASALMTRFFGLGAAALVPCSAL